MLSAAGAYFFQRTSSLITSKRGVGTLNTGELACVVLSLGVAILALDNIAIYDISLGSIAAVILILFAPNMEALQAAPLQVPQQASC